ncbi:PQQ-binding-like beta-propeller repeat protein [Halorussus sp. AFM4]|uniref:outer membrane protein assembly factor BamB family protein n=1 Tax=Halorussus sp. AFM4 TaxID=3421651 RepID=UPI003EB7C208
MTRRPDRPDVPSSSRRRFLKAGLAAAGAASLAGCGYRPGGGDVRWSVQTGTGVYAPDVVLGGDRLLFAVTRSRRSFDFGSDGWGEFGSLTAYDPATGERRWEQETDPLVAATASGDSLVVGHEDGALSAFDPGGKRRWRAPVDGTPREVAVGPDRVYALARTVASASDGSESDAAGSDASEPTAAPTAALLAVGLERGETLWRRSVDVRGDRTLVASSDGVYACRYRGRSDLSVVARSPAGEVRWRVDRRAGPSGGEGAPVVADDTLYVPTDNELFAFGAADGRERWSATVADLRGSPAVAGGTVYQSGAALAALRADDGRERWTFRPTPDGDRSAWGTTGGLATSVAAAADAVYVATGRRLYALAAGSGEVRWRVAADLASDAPIVVGKSAVVRTESGVLRAHRRT